MTYMGPRLFSWMCMAIYIFFIGPTMVQAVSYHPLTIEARRVCVGFLVDKVALGEVFLLSILVFAVGIIPSRLHTLTSFILF